MAQSLAERNGEPVEGLRQRISELEEIATDYGMKFQKAQDALKHQSLLHKSQIEAAEKAAIAVCNRSNHWKERAETAEKRIAEQSAIVAAAEKLVRCKGRYHSELNYRSLAKLFGVNTPNLPPLEHENAHYADAAEMEIAALRQRINELESREINLPAACADDEYFIDGVFQALRYERDVERAIRAAGIGVKGE
ncbi:ead/Ea22-like family protein [Salmonella enterica subsp. enterica serovar Miami]|nr:ead/Ea22-like family protein [Salmonella enterica subsp. enterica serovar Miami]EFP3443581.1 ead/Ea22-like family protein [Salmonella enterica]